MVSNPVPCHISMVWPYRALCITSHKVCKPRQPQNLFLLQGGFPADAGGRHHYLIILSTFFLLDYKVLYSHNDNGGFFPSSSTVNTLG